MDSTQTLTSGTCTITLHGQFTFSDHEDFRGILDQFARPDVQQVVFQMEHVEFIDSSALGMLLLARDESEKHNTKLTISGVSGQVRKMFSMARFETMFSLC